MSAAKMARLLVSSGYLYQFYWRGHIMQQPPGIFDIFAFFLAAALGVKLSALLGPSLVVLAGWSVGFAAAVWLRRVNFHFWGFFFVTLGASLLVASPLAFWVAPKIGLEASSLLGPVGFIIPFSGDLFAKWAKGFIPGWLTRKGGES
jgi:hypothetical protein